MFDEKLARVFGVLRGIRDTIAFTPETRGDPGVTHPYRERIFGEIVLTGGRGWRDHRRPTMCKHHEVAVPILRHGGEQVGAARVLGSVASGDGGEFRGARRCGRLLLS